MTEIKVKLPIILALKLVDGLHGSVHGEVAQRRLAKFLQFFGQLLRLVLALGQDRVNVLVGDLRVFRGKHVVGAVTDHAQHFVLVERVRLVQKATLLDDQLVQSQLDLGAFHDLLFDRVLRDEAEYAHLLLLTDTMGAIHGLQIHLRVPVGIEQNDHVSRGQVDAQTTGTSRQHEDELGTAGFVVLGNLAVAILVRSATIQAAVLSKNSKIF